MYTNKDCGGSMTGTVAIQSGNDRDLMSAVARIGPIAVAVDASSNAFRVCSKAPLTLLNHKLMSYYIQIHVYINHVCRRINYIPYNK